jgi:hypothetical protein
MAKPSIKKIMQETPGASRREALAKSKRDAEATRARQAGRRNRLPRKGQK